jgi:hypothetical protein
MSNDLKWAEAIVTQDFDVEQRIWYMPWRKRMVKKWWQASARVKSRLPAQIEIIHSPDRRALKVKVTAHPHSNENDVIQVCDVKLVSVPYYAIQGGARG